MFSLLEAAYGVRLHLSVRWPYALVGYVVNFNPLFWRVLPGQCLGSMLVRLLVDALWPLAAMLAVLVTMALRALVTTKSSAESAAQRVRAIVVLVCLDGFHLLFSTSMTSLFCVLPKRHAQ